MATMAVAGCSSLQPGASPSLATTAGMESTPPAPATAATATSKQTAIPSTGDDDSGDIRAAAACNATKNDIAMVTLNTGEATLAAAYEVTGEELATYIEATSDSMIAPGQSTWHDQANKVVDACLFDGDFVTKTPGPPGHDTSAVRILVVISDGQAFPWAIARKDPTTLPITDPGTLTQMPHATQSE